MFVLLAAIFLTSAGFLVSAAVAPTSPKAIVPAPTPGSSESRTTVPRLSPKFSQEAPLPQQAPEPPPTIRRRKSA